MAMKEDKYHITNSSLGHMSATYFQIPHRKIDAFYSFFPTMY
jgi:hypothetical protein